VPTSRAILVERAPAKVNLTLRVRGKRRDGYHDIESLIAFAGIHDRLSFAPSGRLKLSVRGPTAAAAGRLSENLVLKAARLLAREIGDLELGHFTLTKNLPVAAGLGGGSSDAAAALRLLARANRLESDDPRIAKVARRIGADVPVCLDPRTRFVSGIGEILSDPLRIPKLPILLVNPGRALGTKRVFARYDRLNKSTADRGSANRAPLVPQWRSAFIGTLATDRNDLEPIAITLVPAIATVLEALRESDKCRLARMSGSGATCFGIFPSARAADVAARNIKAAHPRWWVTTTALG
jgi:4-diphosphocytidyl-2-C-methyl-D-erythritol kinase